MKKRHQRGFTLVEVAIATALIAGLATISLPLISRMQRTQQLRGVARALSGDLMNARSIASSGRKAPGWTSGENRISQAGLFINSTTAYSIFIDRNTARDGDELTARTITLPIGMEIRAPAPGQEIRFRHNGTIVSPVNITVFDRQRNKTRTLVITGGGSVRIL